MQKLNQISGSIIASAIEVHRNLGPGLLETTYEVCLAYELERRGLVAMRQKPLPVVYGDVRLEAGYRVDFFVEGSVIVEVKSVDALAPIHVAQVLTYLKLSGCRLGLLLNFNEELMTDGIRRLVV